jgi:protein subunit release factor A
VAEHTFTVHYSFHPTSEKRGPVYRIGFSDGTTEIDQWDLRTDTHRNEAGATVRLTHLPTGLTSTATHERPSEAEAEALVRLAEAIKVRTKHG